jgi:hypothetical protein
MHTALLAESFASDGLHQVQISLEEILPSWLLGIYVLPERRSDPHVRKFINLIKEGASRLDLQARLL